MRDAFPCNHCGACCKSVELSPQTAGLDRGDGTCRHYDDEERHCRIYAQRPDVCNVEKTYEAQFQHRLTWAVYVDLNVRSCIELNARQVKQSGVREGVA
jgi:Fe-S-cluster containining protein